MKLPQFSKVDLKEKTFEVDVKNAFTDGEDFSINGNFNGVFDMGTDKKKRLIRTVIYNVGEGSAVVRSEKATGVFELKNGCNALNSKLTAKAFEVECTSPNAEFEVRKIKFCYSVINE